MGNFQVRIGIFEIWEIGTYVIGMGSLRQKAINAATKAEPGVPKQHWSGRTEYPNGGVEGDARPELGRHGIASPTPGLSPIKLLPLMAVWEFLGVTSDPQVRR
ncbi:unnamed protein product [Cuscuta europaea]|uniref:Uncharacterized protein n=1 Tax=Cuscuta europaea TaxID=41803 RepID=A0A9P1EMJ4_CUSEU|nr:unnamed protein product [Cuscuta europaea]